MEIKLQFKPFNAKHYSKPWISKVTDWEEGERPHIEFGPFLGTDKKGGYAIISAEAGDIVRFGLKHRYKAKKNIGYKWFIVYGDSQLKECEAEQAKRLHEMTKPYYAHL
jgi:hypothetical protein